jgi:hypothetical protein
MYEGVVETMIVGLIGIGIAIGIALTAIVIGLYYLVTYLIQHVTWT